MVVLFKGLYVFFHREGDFKDEGSKLKGSTKFALIRTRDPRITGPTLYHLGYSIPLVDQATNPDIYRMNVLARKLAKNYAVSIYFWTTPVWMNSTLFHHFERYKDH